MAPEAGPIRSISKELLSIISNNIWQEHVQETSIIIEGSINCLHRPETDCVFVCPRTFRKCCSDCTRLCLMCGSEEVQ